MAATWRVIFRSRLYEAVLGGRSGLPTLGSAVEPHDPQDTSSGRSFASRQGLPKGAGAWPTGDLFHHHPDHAARATDAELEALMQKWRDTHP